MESVVGVFDSLEEVKPALAELRRLGIPDERIDFVAPGGGGEEIDEVPTTEAEAPGIGKALGGVVGGALGAAGGMTLGMAAASLLIPGIGPVIATGLAGAALLGAGGAVGGAKAGEAVEESIDDGLPRDELYVYEDADRHGRAVVIVRAEDDQQAAAARALLAQAGAEDVDAARDSWWIGLRDAAAEKYEGDFTADEAHFRSGFEAAQQPAVRGRAYDEARSELERRHPELYQAEPFRLGYESGRAYYQAEQRRRDAHGPKKEK